MVQVFLPRISTGSPFIIKKCSTFKKNLGRSGLSPVTALVHTPTSNVNILSYEECHCFIMVFFFIITFNSEKVLQSLQIYPLYGRKHFTDDILGRETAILSKMRNTRSRRGKTANYRIKKLVYSLGLSTF